MRIRGAIAIAAVLLFVVSFGLISVASATSTQPIGSLRVWNQVCHDDKIGTEWNIQNGVEGADYIVRLVTFKVGQNALRVEQPWRGGVPPFNPSFILDPDEKFGLLRLYQVVDGQERLLDEKIIYKVCPEEPSPAPTGLFLKIFNQECHDRGRIGTEWNIQGGVEGADYIVRLYTLGRGQTVLRLGQPWRGGIPAFNPGLILNEDERWGVLRLLKVVNGEEQFINDQIIYKDCLVQLFLPFAFRQPVSPRVPEPLPTRWARP